MSRMFSSKTPSVFGTVIIRAATSSFIFDASSARSSVPRGFEASSTTS